ncbi:unnamed protein product, partial [marine sediment metagenome]
MPGWLMEAGEYAMTATAGNFYLPLAGFLCK